VPFQPSSHSSTRWDSSTSTSTTPPVLRQRLTMSRDTRTHYHNTSSELSDSSSRAPSLSRSRGLTLSNLTTRDSANGLVNSGRFNSFNADSTSENRVTMQTRVAVRDNTPHRFQVVPLRDASKHAIGEADNKAQCALPVVHKNQLLRSPSGMLGPYSQTRTSPSPDKFGKDSRHVKGLEQRRLKSSSPCKSSERSLTSRPPTGSVAGSGRRILSEVDLNRDARLSTPRRGMLPVETFTATRSSYSWGSPGSPRRSGKSTIAPNYTTSRSLQLQSRSDKGHHKYTSLGNFEPPRLPRNQATSRSHRSKTLSLSSAARPPFDLLELEAKSTRRHAIYRESLTLPFLKEEPGGFQHLQDDVSDGDEISSSMSCCGSPLLDQDATPKHIAFQLDYGDFSYSIDNSLDSHGDIVNSTLEDPFEIKLKETQEPIAMENGQRCLMLPPIRPLRYSKLTTVKPFPYSTTEKVVYSVIVLGLFRDVDRAMKDWSRVR